MAGHATPGGQVLDRAGIGRDEMEQRSRRQVRHPEAQLQHELPAAHGSRVPGCVGPKLAVSAAHLSSLYVSFLFQAVFSAATAPSISTYAFGIALTVAATVF